MEKRKLISFGSSSYIISIPKAWIRENKLKKGDLISLEERKDEIILSTAMHNHQEEPSQAVINLEDKDLQLAKSEITSAYLNNYDIIEIRGIKDKETTLAIKTLLRGLIGLEIIKQERGMICVKDLLNMNEISIETLIRRMDNIIRSMITDSIISLDENRSEEIYERDEEINRLFFLIARTIRAATKNNNLAKRMGLSSTDLLFTWFIANRMEKVGDLAKRIAREVWIVPLKKEDKTMIRQKYEKLHQDYIEVMKSYYKRDRDIALRTEIRAREMIAECRHALRENESAELRNMIEYLLRMMSCIREITRGVISMENGAGKI